MRLLGSLMVIALSVSSLAARAGDEPAGFWVTPALPGFGQIHYIPQGAYKPDPREHYRVVFAMTAASKDPAAVNGALERVARAVNLYAAAGVALDHLKFVAVAYGGATELTLGDAAYKAAHGIDNPNGPLIVALRKAGVDVAVCGQALAEHNIPADSVHPSVTLALSAITTITTLEHQGYSLMPLF